MQRRAGFLSVWRTGLGAAALTRLPGAAEVPLPPTASRDVNTAAEPCSAVIHVQTGPSFHGKHSKSRCFVIKTDKQHL